MEGALDLQACSLLMMKFYGNVNDKKFHSDRLRILPFREHL